MAQTTIIGNSQVLNRAKQILKDQDLVCFLGHCEKLTVLVGQTTTEDERKKLIAEALEGKVPYIIK